MVDTYNIKYKFFDKVSVITNPDKFYIVTKITISADQRVMYGAVTDTGDYLWFWDYEIEKFKDTNDLGFNIKLKHK